MRSIATLQDVDAGTLVFDGIDIRTQKEKLREVLGYLPQEFASTPRSPRSTCSITRDAQRPRERGAAQKTR